MSVSRVELPRFRKESAKIEVVKTASALPVEEKEFLEELVLFV
jgi:hypothetical protein